MARGPQGRAAENLVKKYAPVVWRPTPGPADRDPIRGPVVLLEASLADNAGQVQHEHARMADTPLLVSDAVAGLSMVGFQVLVQKT